VPLARTVDLIALQQRVERAIAENTTLRADVRFLTGLVNDVATAARELSDLLGRLNDQAGKFETPEDR
jgi:hypothetical protein